MPDQSVLSPAGPRTIVRTGSVPDWTAVPSLPLSHILWEPDCGVSACAQLCHDEEGLSLHLSAQEEHIRAEYTAVSSPVCRDSCLEFFFMPEGDNRYMNLEMNPNGCPYLGFGRGRQDRVVLFRPDLRELLAIRAGRIPGGWEVFARIPLQFLQLFWPGFSFSGCLRANFYKCGDQTVHPHYLAWNRVVSETPDFHRPLDFGILAFASSGR